jgi:uncharacterized membrane protein
METKRIGFGITGLLGVLRCQQGNQRKLEGAGWSPAYYPVNATRREQTCLSVLVKWEALLSELIEPNLHPILVHFAYALSLTAVASYLLAAFSPVERWRETLRPAADWMLAFGAIAIVLTIAAGFQAYYTVDHDAPSHAAMTTHRNWAVPSGLAILLLAAWRWTGRAKAASGLFVTGLAAAALALTVTAWWGGKIVK